MTAKQAFAKRLVESMLEKGMASARGAQAGVDVGPLARAAKVSREMARRYTSGKAMPDPNKMAPIADWLGVRVAWLRDNDGEKYAIAQPAPVVQEPAAAYMPEEAREIAQVWLKLPKDRRECFRDLMCLEAMVTSHYPWLMFGRPRSESYAQYETRGERDILRLAARLTTPQRQK